MNQVKISVTHFLAETYLHRLTNIKLLTNCCQQCGWDETDCKNVKCIISEWVVSLSAYWKNTFSYSPKGIIISFKDGFAKNNQHMPFVRFSSVEFFNRNFGLFIFRRNWWHSTEENMRNTWLKSMVIISPTCTCY